MKQELQRKEEKPKIIILGDSYNNTLGLIRSVGEAGVKPVLILSGNDRLFVSKSRYVRKTFFINEINESLKILEDLSDEFKGAYIISSNDKAAKFVDDNEDCLSSIYKTPMRGGKIGKLFEKSTQCKLAEECGITVPKSIIFHKEDSFNNFDYPIFLKPNDSNRGSKSDIHICHSEEELQNILAKESNCSEFILQQYIEKDNELNLIGVSISGEVYIPGGIKKIRHYPNLQSPCSYGLYLPIKQLGIDIEPILHFVKKTCYSGPFSIEMLHVDNKNYFMEMNFRHDGLAYTATAAGTNLLGLLIDKPDIIDLEVKPTYMMDLSIDYCHVKKGNIRRNVWLKDFLRTGCQLNFNRKDPKPTICYYMSKILE